MARLILLNGAPGSGKSTLARRYVEEHPLALNLDVDRIRDLVGGWRQAQGEAGLAARAIALAAARTHLAAGHDVVLPQLIARSEEAAAGGFLFRLDELAAETGAEVTEILLTDSLENTRLRFASRTDGPGLVDPFHREAAQQLELSGGLAELDRYHRLLQDLPQARPAMRVVHTRAGRIDEAYRAVLAEVAASESGSGQRKPTR